MTVVLHVRRASGSTELHRLPADGDYVLVPRGLLSADDVLGFDVEVTGPDHCSPDHELARPGARDAGGARTAPD